ncbi:unnamed protein product [Caenorhabditis nigoni]
MDKKSEIPKRRKRRAAKQKWRLNNESLSKTIPKHQWESLLMKQYTQQSEDQKIYLRFILSSELRITKKTTHSGTRSQ